MQLQDTELDFKVCHHFFGDNCFPSVNCYLEHLHIMEMQEKLEVELKRQTQEAASRVEAVLQKVEEQGQMIESLHASVSLSWISLLSWSLPSSFLVLFVIMSSFGS